jgi:hypothetical protein
MPHQTLVLETGKSKHITTAHLNLVMVTLLFMVADSVVDPSYNLSEPEPLIRNFDIRILEAVPYWFERIPDISVAIEKKYVVLVQ